MESHEVMISQNPVNINSSLPGQNGRRFADDIFRCISWITNFVFWLKFVPNGIFDSNPALV